MSVNVDESKSVIHRHSIVKSVYDYPRRDFHPCGSFIHAMRSIKVYSEISE